MKKSIILSLLLLFTAMSCLAIPAKHVRRYLTLKDGTKIMATLKGDENGHWYEDDNGRALIEDSLGIASYLSEFELRMRKEARAEKFSMRNNMRKARLAKNGDSSMRQTRASSGSLYTGKKKGLIILVNFKDKMFTYAQKDFYALANEKGYNKNGAQGSVSDYFYDQSYGAFDLKFDVVGPYNLSKVMSYYGRNVDSKQKGDDAMPGEMVTEAVKLADKDVNFADYDWDHDGEVDQVYIVYAGYSEAQGAPSTTIWPHEWNLESAKFNDNGGNGAVRLDNVWINTYACSSELNDKKGTVMAGIGSMCHEFSHCLGLPDMYDTQGDNFGMDAWSIMDCGSYNGNDKVPCGYTSYERWQAGWLKPVELSKTCTINNMKPLTDSPEAYVIYNDANHNEYYLLENRQYTSWDSEGYGHGLLILHVDYDNDAWTNNTINNDASHQRLTIFHADNDAYYTTLSGDPYPGVSKNTSLTDTSRPAAKLFNNNKQGKRFMSKPVTNIAESASGMISFKFTNPQATSIEMPMVTESSAPKRIYSITGQYLGTDPKKLPQGVYKVK